MEGRYTTGHNPETGKPICKNVLGRTQSEGKEKPTTLDLQQLYKILLAKGGWSVWSPKDSPRD